MLLCPGTAPLTLHEEEEADDADGGDDDAGHDEGQTPGGGNPDAGDERPQDVTDGGVRVPDAHDQTSPGGDGATGMGGELGMGPGRPQGRGRGGDAPEEHSLAFPEPVPDARHHGGPPGGLHQPVADLARERQRG